MKANDTGLFQLLDYQRSLASKWSHRFRYLILLSEDGQAFSIFHKGIQFWSQRGGTEDGGESCSPVRTVSWICERWRKLQNSPQSKKGKSWLLLMQKGVSRERCSFLLLLSRISCKIGYTRTLSGENSSILSLLGAREVKQGVCELHSWIQVPKSHRKPTRDV